MVQIVSVDVRLVRAAIAVASAKIPVVQAFVIYDLEPRSASGQN